LFSIEAKNVKDVFILFYLFYSQMWLNFIYELFPFQQHQEKSPPKKKKKTPTFWEKNKLFF